MLRSTGAGMSRLAWPRMNQRGPGLQYRFLAAHAALKSKLAEPRLLREEGFVGGKWVSTAENGQRVDILNPATDQVIATVPDMGEAETVKAVEIAEAAGSSWAKLLAKDRALVLERWFDLMMQHREDLAQIMTAECGKPLTEARGEIAYAASFLQWFAEEAKRAYGDVIPPTAGGRRILVIKQPVGVCGLITPWNFPIAMITRKIGPALAAGCTAVIKPSEDTPLSALAAMELAVEAGLPEGVASVIPGSRAQASAIGTVLATHPSVRKISFTGSTAVGKHLLAQSSNTVKRVSLELGGNAPFIVFDDADIDAAVDGAIASKFRNAGQTCVCANRIFVQSGVYEEFAEKLSQRVSKFQVGDGAQDGVFIGPLINSKGLQKVHDHLNDAVQHGAVVKTGGAALPEVGSNFFAPTVLTEVKQDMRIFTEETFGPIAPLIRFTSEEEVVMLANSTRAGLAAYFYSRDVGRCFRISEALEYGMVGVNEGIISTEVAPFGGIKESGLGREGSRMGLEEYQESKYLCMGGV
eukprot:gnl/MRDRNA2_/MRDRNA2_27758_c0_seq1.p1 gnl/MRDRNA2_/MRDRNA2_27758_c0~~gnl/MRDRNA2_/MRDRNA2_27758_c0_seq1.p1  ORF type:complete len:525 (+),score=106.98 gnl/MRDRNA2_/MRDRNA2_27758_c0_seq1:71-1645(+)